MAGYLLTPGLKNYPYHSRFSIWCAAYRFLLNSDLETQLRKKIYVTRILLCVTLMIAAAPLGFFLARVHPLVGIVFPIAITLATTLAILLLACRHQYFLNRKIDTLLRDMRYKESFVLPEVVK